MGGGGGRQPPHDAPPMMIEKVMIQLEARGCWGGRQPPHDDRKSDDSIRGKESKNSGGVGGAAAPP